jgi:geranylgeranylglycerol-phosphate geranylgeranyltransferase
MGFHIKNLKSFLQLVRFEHGVMYGIGVLVGAMLAGWTLSPVFSVLLGFAVALLLEIGAFALNDYIDYKADKINKRTDRPIVRGDVSRDAALLIGVGGFLAANVLSLYYLQNNPEAFLLILLFSVFSLLYNYWLKRFALIGNVFIGLTMAIPFVFGGLMLRNVNDAIAILAGIAFIIGLGREIMKDIEDIEGDRKVGAKTLPLVVGVRKSVYSVVICYAAGIALSIIPFFSFFASKPVYFGIFVADAMLLYVSFRILNSQRLETFRFGRKWSLYSAAVALAVFLLSTVI